MNLLPQNPFCLLEGAYNSKNQHWLIFAKVPRVTEPSQTPGTQPRRNYGHASISALNSFTKGWTNSFRSSRMILDKRKRVKTFGKSLVTTCKWLDKHEFKLWIQTTTTTTTTLFAPIHSIISKTINKINRVKCMAAQNNHDWLTRLGSHT